MSFTAVLIGALRVNRPQVTRLMTADESFSKIKSRNQSIMDGHTDACENRIPHTHTHTHTQTRFVVCVWVRESGGGLGEGIMMLQTTSNNVLSVF